MGNRVSDIESDGMYLIFHKTASDNNWFRGDRDVRTPWTWTNSPSKVTPFATREAAQAKIDQGLRNGLHFYKNAEIITTDEAIVFATLRAMGCT